jgi:hypothetical protein
MTKDEFLKNAGYVPIMGRPKIFDKKSVRYVIQVTPEMKKKLLKAGGTKVREILQENL